MASGHFNAFTERHWRQPPAGVLTVVLVALLAPGVARAQEAELRGVVKDLSGAAAPGASVTAALEATGVRRDVTTDAAGRYAMPFLTPGTYTITVALDGFQTVARTGVVLETGAETKHGLNIFQPR